MFRAQVMFRTVAGAALVLCMTGVAVGEDGLVVVKDKDGQPEAVQVVLVKVTKVEAKKNGKMTTSFIVTAERADNKKEFGSFVVPPKAQTYTTANGAKVTVDPAQLKAGSVVAVFTKPNEGADDTVLLFKKEDFKAAKPKK